MDICELPAIKSDSRGAIYLLGELKLITRKKGTISADHKHEEAETLYLISGDIELTADDKTIALSSPVAIKFRSNEYHKIYALTDIFLLEKHS